METTPTPTATAPSPAKSPLSGEQLAAFRDAEKIRGGFRRAIGVAYLDAWTGSIMAALCLLSGFFSVVGIVLGVALSVVAWNSFRGARRLKKMDESAARLLAMNQAFLFLCITVYCLFNIYQARQGQGEANAIMGDLSTGEPSADATINSIKDLWTTLVSVAYLAIIGGSLVAQGLAGLYYYTRGKKIREYKTQTAKWILELQAAQTG